MTQDGNTILGAQITISAVIVFLMNVVKHASWFPWLNAETAKLNRAVAWLLAGAAAVGIHASFNAETHVLTITGLGLTSILHGGFDWVRSVAVQEWIFRSTKP